MDHGIAGSRFQRQSRLWIATDRDDGEVYLIWLIEKTGAAVDCDILRLLRDTVRRVRGALARQSARAVLLELVDIVEDDREFGLRMIGADGTLSALSIKTRRRLHREFGSNRFRAYLPSGTRSVVSFARLVICTRARYGSRWHH